MHQDFKETLHLLADEMNIPIQQYVLSVSQPFNLDQVQMMHVMLHDLSDGEKFFVTLSEQDWNGRDRRELANFCLGALVGMHAMKSRNSIYQ